MKELLEEMLLLTLSVFIGICIVLGTVWVVSKIIRNDLPRRNDVCKMKYGEEYYFSYNGYSANLCISSETGEGKYYVEME